MSPTARERALKALLLDAAEAYVDATERGEGERLSGMTAAAHLRMAAKDWVRAKRGVVT